MSIDNSDLLLARVNDACDHAENGRGIRFIGFLDEKSAYLAEKTAIKRGVKHMLYGGCEGARRCFLAVFSDYMDCTANDFPIIRLHTQLYKPHRLSHRDFLGALINGGIRRESIGDIFISEDCADVFTADKMAAFICENIDRIGGAAVAFKPDGRDFKAPEAKFDELSFTVNSPRLDAVIAHLTGKSRESASTYIKSGNVEIDYAPCDSVTRILKNSQTVSVRGYGKFVIDSVDGKSKKGRNIIKVRKYK